jgi:excisionase family DNA binding protein
VENHTSLRGMASGDAMPGKATRQVANPLAVTARELREARRILEGVETQALAGVALMLSETAESLARTASELATMQREEWMNAEEAAAYLRRTPKAFEKIVRTGEIPKHYVSERGILFSRSEIDEWLMNR